MIKGTSNTTPVILGILIIILTYTLIPIGLQGQPYPPGTFYNYGENENETETNEESHIGAHGIQKDSESGIGINASTISKSGEKDVICENGSSQQHRNSDSCNPYSDGTGFEDNNLVPSYKCDESNRMLITDNETGNENRLCVK